MGALFLKQTFAAEKKGIRVRQLKAFTRHKNRPIFSFSSYVPDYDSPGLLRTLCPLNGGRQWFNGSMQKWVLVIIGQPLWLKHFAHNQNNCINGVMMY